MAKRRCSKGRELRALRGKSEGNTRLTMKNLVIDTFDMVVSHNLNAGVAKPDKYKASNDGSNMMPRARVPFTRLSIDPKHNPNRKTCILRDNDLYEVKLDVTGGGKQQSMIRTGTTPERHFPLVLEGFPVLRADGFPVMCKSPEKPKWGVVGLSTSKP